MIPDVFASMIHDSYKNFLPDSLFTRTFDHLLTTYITTAHEEISTIECSLNSDLIAVHNWLKTNKLSCNTSKTSYMTIGSRLNLANAKFMSLELD